jgi:membrane protease YdiL (CAAX protease family)
MDMSESPPPEPQAPQMSWIFRAQALFEVILLGGAASSLLAGLPFAYIPAGRENLISNIHLLSAYVLLEASITFVLLFLVMGAHGETLRWLGWQWRRLRTEVILGLALVPLLFALNFLVSIIFQAFFQRYFLERNPLTDLIRGPGDLALFIVVALIAGGIKEEVQRAFIVRRFQVYLGGASLGLIIWSVAFGIGHYVQGTQGMIAAGIFGLIFGIAYVARGSLIAPMIAHGVYDTVTLLGYWFFASHIS